MLDKDGCKAGYLCGDVDLGDTAIGGERDMGCCGNNCDCCGGRSLDAGCCGAAETDLNGIGEGVASNVRFSRLGNGGGTVGRVA